MNFLAKNKIEQHTDLLTRIEEMPRQAKRRGIV